MTPGGLLPRGRTVAVMVVAAAACALVTARATGSMPGSGSPVRTPAAAPSCALPSEARVTRVTDGDTVHVELCGVDTTVRVIGVNTPETRKPRTPVQCYGPQASAYAHQQLDGQVVTLTGDRRAGSRDKYGRTLAFVEVAGRDYGLYAVRAGLAEANDYGHRQSRTGEYVDAQAQARRELAGAWGACPNPFKS